MKISLNFKNIYNNNAVREGGRNPFVDWIMILITFSLFTIIFIYFGFILFFRIKNTDNINNNSVKTNNKDIFDLKSFNNLIDKFENRSLRLKDMNKELKIVSDPSK